MPRALNPGQVDARYCGEAFGRTARWFRSARAALEARGFPAPLPRFTASGTERGRMTWLKSEVDAFIARTRSGERPTANDNSDAPRAEGEDALDRQRAAALRRL